MQFEVDTEDRRARGGRKEPQSVLAERWRESVRKPFSPGEILTCSLNRKKEITNQTDCFCFFFFFF